METKKFIQIGESVHASIPKTGKVMKQLLEKGNSAFAQPSEELKYIIELIADQAENGADYIAVNLDAFGEDDPKLPAELMKQYVRLVKEHGKSVPVCIDSSDDNTLIAGLEQWHNENPSATIPLVNSVKTNTMDVVLPLREKYPFKVVGMLIDETGKEPTVDEIYKMAKTIFETAVGKYGFEPDDMFFDTTAYPLAIDTPMQPDTPSYTYRCFEAIKKIKSDPEMKNAHCSLGISNSVKDLPARKIGIARAYMQKAAEYGLDAGIVNVHHGYNDAKPAAPELIELVRLFAENDGSMTASLKAMEAMGNFCRDNRK